MKKLKVTLTLSVAGLMCFSNNIFAATASASTAESSASVTKYIAIGVAALIIVLLLFLGYKLDSKDSNESNYLAKKSKKDKKKKTAKKEDIKYEADSVAYKADNVDSNDLTETTEYEEDDENNSSEEPSLFSTMNDDEELGIDTPITKTLVEDQNENIKEPEDLEDYGEEFDTSIIDDIDDEEISDDNKKMEETMIFNNPPVSSLAEPEEKIEDVDPTMDELSKIDKTETTFEGFSVSDKKVEEKKEEKPHKKYTKVKKDSISTDDFLAQVEENLKRDKEERDARKSKK